MKNMKFWRTALVATLVLTIMLSVTGGTIAWFTDEVTSASNVIESGNLDIKVSYKTDLKQEWQELTKDSKVFKQGALYEPGYTEIVYLKVENNGTLATKVQAGINAKDTVIGKSVLGNEIALSDYLAIGAFHVTTEDGLSVNLSTREDAVNWVGSSVAGFSDMAMLSDKLENGSLMLNSGNLVLIPDVFETLYMGLVLRMPEEIGNEANHDGTVVPAIELGLNVVATQVPYEKDAFGTDYDAEAIYPAYVNSAADLAEALEAGGNVTLTGDIEVAEVIEIPEGTKAILNLNGKTITGVAHKSVGAVLKNNGDLTISGGTVSSTAANGGSAIANNGTLTAENVTLNGASNADGSWPAYTINNTGIMTLSNANITSVHGAVCSYGDGAVLTLNNSSIDMSGIPGFTSHGIYTYDNGKVVVNGGTYANKATDQNASGASVINGDVEVNAGTFSGRIENYYGTPVIKGGAFTSDPSKYVAEGYQVIGNYLVVEAESVKETAEGSGLYVGEDGTKFATTQAAIKAALSEANANVVLSPGEYTDIPSIAKGVTIDGNGAVFNDTLGSTNGVTIKDVTFNAGNAQRWGYASGDVVFENVTFDADSVYAIHYDGTSGANITYRNCKIIGWAAIAGGHNSLTFENCEIYGNGTYGLIRCYSDATIKNCTFDVDNVNTTDVYQDGIHAVDCTITVIGGTNVNGEMEDLFNTSGTGVINFQ